MRIGIFVVTEGTTLRAMTDQVDGAARAGLDSAYFAQLTAWDALTVLTLVGQRVPDIELGTSVVQTYPRHPLALAGQALTAQAAIGNRLVLGVGPSHPSIIEGGFGYSYERPARHVREYLGALRPLLRGEQVDYRGETLAASGRVEVPGAAPPPVLISALGPVMLRLAGELADGTVTVWATPETIGEHVVPAITKAARAAGRPAPRVVASLLAGVTARPEELRGELAARLGAAGEQPSYRALLDRQGTPGVADTIAVGDEDAVAGVVRRYAEAAPPSCWSTRSATTRNGPGRST
ncbi:TIGR03564 family F420-dependent LLM class oxidoreductase [Pseudonocardia acaciae]|uniref:TIGR03564 family F420-dependent LLM class oxidoreductase n=1 Tax=Pseudonocardia acaciae TaxID=551276 RepID=UPI000B0AAB9B|nr:TIGR03564 family F420-dependent LLM class oxidoreductase [Pseudonocardia acaciae]